MQTAAEIAKVRSEYLERLRRANQKEYIDTLQATYGWEKWDVRITRRAGEYFEVAGRGSAFDVYLSRTNWGYLVAIPNWHRAGIVPEDVNADGIMEYVGIGNLVDAATLAAAIRFLIRRGFADGPQG